MANKCNSEKQRFLVTEKQIKENWIAIQSDPAYPFPSWHLTVEQFIDLVRTEQVRVKNILVVLVSRVPECTDRPFRGVDN